MFSLENAIPFLVSFVYLSFQLTKIDTKTKKKKHILRYRNKQKEGEKEINILWSIKWYYFPCYKRNILLWIISYMLLLSTIYINVKRIER